MEALKKARREGGWGGPDGVAGRRDGGPLVLDYIYGVRERVWTNSDMYVEAEFLSQECKRPCGIRSGRAKSSERNESNETNGIY